METDATFDTRFIGCLVCVCVFVNVASASLVWGSAENPGDLYQISGFCGRLGVALPNHAGTRKGVFWGLL